MLSLSHGRATRSGGYRQRKLVSSTLASYALALPWPNNCSLDKSFQAVFGLRGCWGRAAWAPSGKLVTCRSRRR